MRKDGGRDEDVFKIVKISLSYLMKISCLGWLSVIVIFCAILPVCSHQVLLPALRFTAVCWLKNASLCFNLFPFNLLFFQS